ncbi:hypothetical protein ANCDUO_17753 [Ancylostoma duodenale]|uniref:Protein kinase domain-containing protein n=1 Tax=Ancylostoma duodenale TaxID=51022 RepID=A0A0C2CQS1_9BILA|nr:hypothetical protein ANCDUO_17753 [Ancylostoma duodenale]
MHGVAVDKEPVLIVMELLKIGDFGLTREGDIYHMATTRKLPIKWIPPEIIVNNTFSFKSDVWSFGILGK